MKPAPGVRFDRVWKKFRRGERHDSLRDLIPAAARRLVRARKPNADREPGRGEFWAVRDLSFDVAPGEALGIIGPNGAGKSTVLKLLTRILRPTRGTSEVRGRAGALIEIGAGFHPDLTGRENVYLQGAIMGMSRHEIAAKFDEIVEFSGVAPFIDTPVKRYSSGMNARLGFSIAVHMDPDVLIVDEVLAVGDHAFQNRAFGRIRAVAARGTPVVVVSHQLDRIASLCNKAILLEEGVPVRAGTPAECIAQYVMGTKETGHRADCLCPVYLERFALESPTPIVSGSYFRVRLHGVATPREDLGELAVAITVRALATGEVVFVTGTVVFDVSLPARGPFEIVLDLQANTPEGLYSLHPHVWNLRKRRDDASGPTLTIQVEPDPLASGPVNMNPRMALIEPSVDPRPHRANGLAAGGVLIR